MHKAGKKSNNTVSSVRYQVHISCMMQVDLRDVVPSSCRGKNTNVNVNKHLNT